MTAELKVERIALGARYFDEKPWTRRMTAGDTPDITLVRQGIYPGQNYPVDYTMYRLDVTSGAEMVAVGANGGPTLDPTFVRLEGNQIVVRAADDHHRDRLIDAIETTSNERTASSRTGTPPSSQRRSDANSARRSALASAERNARRRCRLPDSIRLHPRSRSACPCRTRSSRRIGRPNVSPQRMVLRGDSNPISSRQSLSAWQRIANRWRRTPEPVALRMRRRRIIATACFGR